MAAWLVLGKLGENGLSQAEFIATYAAPEITATDHTVGTVAQAAADGVELVYNFDAAAAESAAAFTWTLSPEQITRSRLFLGELDIPFAAGKHIFDRFAVGEQTVEFIGLHAGICLSHPVQYARCICDLRIPL